MSKLCFLFGLSVRELKKNVRINLLAVLSLALGMLLPLIALADMNVFYLNMKNLYPGISRDAWYCNIRSEHLTEEDYAELKENLHLARIGGCEKRTDEVIIGGRRIMDALCVISEGFPDFVEFDLLEGVSLAGPEALPGGCMVEETFAATFGLSVQTGDIMEVNGETYTITGIFRSMELAGKVLVPLAGFRESGIRNKNQYILFVQTEPGGAGALQEKLQERLYQVHNVEEIERYYERKRQSLADSSLMIFLVTVPAVVFSVVNCILVLCGKVYRTKRETGIKIAVGANGMDLFLACFFETSLLAFGAYFLDILCVPLVVKTVPPQLSVLFTFNVYVAGFLLLEVMCLFISGSVCRKMTKLDVAAVLKGEG